MDLFRLKNKQTNVFLNGSKLLIYNFNLFLLVSLLLMSISWLPLAVRLKATGQRAEHMLHCQHPMWRWAPQMDLIITCTHKPILKTHWVICCTFIIKQTYKDNCNKARRMPIASTDSCKRRTPLSESCSGTLKNREARKTNCRKATTVRFDTTKVHIHAMSIFIQYNGRKVLAS